MGVSDKLSALQFVVMMCCLKDIPNTLHLGFRSLCSYKKMTVVMKTALRYLMTSFMSMTSRKLIFQALHEFSCYIAVVCPN